MRAQIAMTLFDLSELPQQRGPLPAEPEVPRPDALSGYRDTLRYGAGLVGKAVAGAIRSRRG